MARELTTWALSKAPAGRLQKASSVISIALSTSGMESPDGGFRAHMAQNPPDHQYAPRTARH